MYTKKYSIIPKQGKVLHSYYQEKCPWYIQRKYDKLLLHIFSLHKFSTEV